MPSVPAPPPTSSLGTGLLRVWLLATFMIGVAAAQNASPLVPDDAALDAPPSHFGTWDPDGIGRGYLAMGAAWHDANQDGHLDLFVAGGEQPNTLLENRGDGTFDVSPHSADVALEDRLCGGGVWGDFDNDGYPDLFVNCDGQNALFRNLQGTGFEDVTDAMGLTGQGKSTSATWGDYNQDGLLDLYVSNWTCSPECVPEDVTKNQDVLYRNDGDRFTDVTADLLDVAATRGAALAVVFADLDLDGDADLFIANDKYRHPIGNVLFRNDGPGCNGWCWTDVSKAMNAHQRIHSMGVAIGDLTQNGALDLYISNMMSPMLLLLGQPSGPYEDATQIMNVGINPPGTAVGWGTAFADLDHNGHLDLYLATSGMPALAGSFYSGTQPDLEDFRRPYPDAVFMQQPDGSLQAVTPHDHGDAAEPNMALSMADYDNDGDVDAALGIWQDRYRLLRNTTSETAPDRGWIMLDLRGGGPVNREALGATVRVTTTSGVTYVQTKFRGGTFGGNHDPRMHFGLGDDTVAGVSVTWPDGQVSEHGALTAGSLHVLNHPEAP